MISSPHPPPFDGFGRSALWTGSRPRREIVLDNDPREVRHQLRRQCPAAPGIYGMIDGDGRLIYVGKSKTLCHRLLSYFSAGAQQSKAGRIAEHARRLTWEPVPHEFLALLRELELIRRWQPRFNVRGRRQRHHAAYICLGQSPAPRAYLADRPPKADSMLMGPVRVGRRFRDAVRLVNDWFQLRDCPQRTPIRFADQLECFPQERTPRCLRFEMGTCLGPCVGACTSRQYQQQAQGAAAFLRGSDPAVLARIEAAMRLASAAQQFERAAALRDGWNEVRALFDQLQHFRLVRRDYHFIYSVASARGRVYWCLVRGGVVSAVLPEPHDDRSRDLCFRVIEDVYGAEQRSWDHSSPEDMDAILLVASWFRQHPEELCHTQSPAEAAARCGAPSCALRMAQ